jgi:transcriptional regulator with XRE-family HTH domain
MILQAIVAPDRRKLFVEPPHSTFMTFGSWLRERLHDARMSNSELARLTGVSSTHISNLVRDFSPNTKKGVGRPSLDLVDRIADALKLDRDEVRIKAGYAPEQPLIIKKPQTLDELIEALEHLGIENLHFHEHDRLRTATPRQLQEVLDAVKLAVQLMIARQENEGHENNSGQSHDDESNTLRSDR